MSPDMPWSTAAAIVCAACLVGGGTIALIVALYRDEKRRQYELMPPFDASVGRDVYREMVRK